MNRIYSFRRIYFETATALHAGSGESDPVQDMPIQTDVNGFPTICASSIAGVLRHLWGEGDDDLFGLKNGSRLCVGDAVVIDDNGVPVVGIRGGRSEYLDRISRVSRRDHCAINHRGAANTENKGKFDRSVLIAGVRFVTEFCLSAGDGATAKAEADKLTGLFLRPDFRLGGGTRNGFGRITVLRITGKEYDLDIPEERAAFLKRSASPAEDPAEPELPIPATAAADVRTIMLEPEDFWLASDGAGLGDLDIRPKVESLVRWSDSGVPDIYEEFLLPATSVKGALAHRTAYYYNKLCGRFAETLSKEELRDPNPPNKAVRAIFGYAKGDAEKKDPGRIGRVIISDIYCADSRDQIFNHVSIDRFTGGALNSALFTEMVRYGGKLKLDIVIEPSPDKDEDPQIMEAFEKALEDLENGRLPLGGGVMRGLGVMHAVKNEEA